jgi:predicted HAD superfamily Cof-like phosphohydrolase
MESVIDGCVDTIYVATGTLAAYGVPDLPHIVEVNRANEAKFPNGKATLNDAGKFQKPEGWTGPDHALVRSKIAPVNLFAIGQDLVEGGNNLRRDTVPVLWE